MQAYTQLNEVLLACFSWHGSTASGTREWLSSQYFQFATFKTDPLFHIEVMQEKGVPTSQLLSPGT